MVALCQSHTSFVSTTKEEKFNLIVLEYSQKKFQKLTKRDNKLRNTVEDILNDLRNNPFQGKKLNVNFDGCRSIHFLKNKYRIIYAIFEDKKEILVLEIGHRKDCYSDLAKALRRGF